MTNELIADGIYRVSGMETSLKNGAWVSDAGTYLVTDQTKLADIPEARPGDIAFTAGYGHIWQLDVDSTTWVELPKTAAGTAASQAAASATAAAGSASAAAASASQAQTVAASIPADYTSLSNSVVDLKSTLEFATGVERIPITYPGQYIGLNGGVGSTIDFDVRSSNASWNCYVDQCVEGDVYTIDVAGGQTPRAYAWLDSSKKILYAAPASTAVTGEVFAPVNAAYIVCDDNSGGYVYKGRTVSETVNDAISYMHDKRLSNSTYTINGILNQSGTNVTSVGNYKSTDYISITDVHWRVYGQAFPTAYYNSFVLYDANKTPIYMAHNAFDINLSVDYPTAKYYRASYDSSYPDDLYVCFGPEITKNRVITVGAGQMYTTLRGGIEAAVKYDSSTVIVYPGTYDLTSEYATEISAATGQVGVELANNVYVKFLAGSYVTALFPTSSEWINTYFQPFRGRDFTLDGLNIEASNCRYCIHDEMNGTDVKYHNVYKNCIMKYTRTSNSGVTGTVYGQCIGGGLGKYGYIEVVGGKYTSITEVSAGFDMPCISYHNGSTAGCDSKIFIRDAYLDGTNGIFRFGYYGSSTIKSQVLVSGCSMGGEILHVAETSGSTVDNFEITEWNNTIRY